MLVSRFQSGGLTRDSSCSFGVSPAEISDVGVLACEDKHCDVGFAFRLAPHVDGVMPGDRSSSWFGVTGCGN
eukprot:scaffold90234_cov32-Tisochrysis_lutea.AAC.3